MGTVAAAADIADNADQTAALVGQTAVEDLEIGHLRDARTAKSPSQVDHCQLVFAEDPG